MLRGLRSRAGRVGGILLAVAAIAMSLVASQTPQAAHALTGSSFSPGNIISDYAFYNKNAMTQADIQAFLDKECPTLNCIDSLKTTTISQPADDMCPGGYTAATNETTAAIIYKIEQSCGISARVILVTLQKEESLVTMQNPPTAVLRIAMGYNCPDSAPCSSSTSGFFLQLYDAAHQFIRYGLSAPDNVSFHYYPIGSASSIRYSPTAKCGSKSVTIADKATAALYYYTPYTPDAAALTNLTGVGDACSSYGNRNFWVYYNNWFGSPTTTVPPGVTVSRIGGADRYDVAVGVSEANFSAGVPVVYIADGTNFPDALSAGPSAAKQAGPLLLVEPNSIPSEVATELTRLKPQSIVVVGGTASVSPAVYTQLATFAPTITRVGGADRYAVSEALAQLVFGTTGAPTVFVATGRTFPDALSAGAAAGSLGEPVILIDGQAKLLDPGLVSLLASLHTTRIDIAGGPASVLPSVQSELAGLPGITAVTRYGGADRYQVSGAINRAMFTTSNQVYVATGVTFPDALAGGAVAGAQHAPLYIVETSCIPSYMLDDFLTLKPTGMTILGGTGSLSSKINEFVGC